MRFAVTKKETKQFNEIMRGVADAALLRKVGDYLQRHGFVFSVIGNQTPTRWLHATMIAPNGDVYLYQSDTIDLVALSSWALHLSASA